MGSDTRTPCTIRLKANGPKKTKVLIFRDTSDFLYYYRFLAAISSKRRLGRQNRLYFLNPECVRIQWVESQKNFLLKNFGYGAFYQKKTFLRIYVSRL